MRILTRVTKEDRPRKFVALESPLWLAFGLVVVNQWRDPRLFSPKLFSVATLPRESIISSSVSIMAECKISPNPITWVRQESPQHHPTSPKSIRKCLGPCDRLLWGTVSSVQALPAVLNSETPDCCFAWNSQFNLCASLNWDLYHVWSEHTECHLLQLVE